MRQVWFGLVTATDKDTQRQERVEAPHGMRQLWSGRDFVAATDRETQIQVRAKVPHGMRHFWFGRYLVTATDRDMQTARKG